ncbi:MAG: sulfate ABC transporter substrate-binding protein [Candidatus Omnitrophica bacterium CG1_02_46_14]|nr:MAG: sulfate ABC transporter substrate-binding protein [Candidatus Omnitrophica bacterium CG1_02_46_14]
MKKLWFIILILGIGIGSATKTSADPMRTTVRLGHFSNITHAQGVIGHANHWFEEALAPEAVVDWKIFNAGPSAIEALFAGQLDIVYIGPSPAINAYVKSDGEAVRIISGSSSGGAALVVRADAGIVGLKDFHGKKIASPQLGNTQDVALRSWLIKQGLKLKEVGGDVEVLPLANADQQTLFLKKEIDAAWTVEPWVSILTQTAYGKVFLDESSLWKDGEYATTVVLVRTKFIDEHPDLVKRVLKTHIKLTDWINANPEEAKKVLKNEIELETGRPLPQTFLDEAWKRIKFTTNPLYSTIREQALSAYRVGFLKKEPDLRFLYDTRLLKELSEAKVAPPLVLST